MKLTLSPTKKVKQEVQGFLATLDEPFTTTKRLALAGVFTAMLTGLVIGFLCAPDRTKNITLGSYNGDTFLDSLEEEEEED